MMDIIYLRFKRKEKQKSKKMRKTKKYNTANR